MREIIVKSILNKKKKRDDWFLDDYTLNPYEGCSFNCQYCYIRGSKYGQNMTDTLAVKINALPVLDRQLAFRVKKNQRGIIALASATDPYLGAEEKYQITSGILKLIAYHAFPVLVITKSTLILRDLDLLKEIDTRAIHAPDLKDRISRGVVISFSISTLDEKLSSALEPGAPPPISRLETMLKCKEAGFLVGVNCIPALPFISDTEEALEEMISAARNYGADYILIGGLTLFGDGPADSKTLYFKFLERTFPELIAPYKELYGSFFMPPEYYRRRLEMRSERLCKQYDIRTSILET